MNDATPSPTELRAHAGTLRLHGLLAHWAEVMNEPEQALSNEDKLLHFCKRSRHFC